MALSDALNNIAQNKQTNTGIANNNFTTLQGLNKPYQDSTSAIGQKYNTTGTQLGQNYLNDTSNAASTLGNNLMTQNSQSVMAGLPALQNSLRESLAGSGGLSRGAYATGANQLGQQAANSIYTGNQGILNNELQARENALGTVYGNNSAMNNTLLGNDISANGAVYGNNINQNNNLANSLMGINNTATEDTNGIIGAQNNQDIAQQAARGAQLASLLQAGGTLIGGMYGGPVGAAAGNKLGSSLATSTSRGTVNNVG